MIPFRTPFILPYLYPSLLWRMPSDQKTLYLTFDDGPVPGPTEFVLDTLQSSGVKGTFFCIGDNIKKHPHVFRRIADGGHSIGNHTFNHLNGWKTETQKYVNNVKLCDYQISSTDPSLTEGNQRLFRPPYGRITVKQIKLLKDLQIVMWDVLTHDYNQRMSPEYCLEHAIRATRNGSIIVFHDSLKAAKNMLFMLPRYIDHFSSEGYSFKSLST
jgi:peptidoglycan-N-acetylglucosamine deacetylase